MKLASYLERHSVKDGEFAEAIGVTRQAVHRYKIGDRFPEKNILSKIFEVTSGQVTANDFADLPDDSDPSPHPIEAHS